MNLPRPEKNALEAALESAGKFFDLCKPDPLGQIDCPSKMCYIEPDSEHLAKRGRPSDCYG